MNAREFLARVEGVKKTAEGWVARCPAHDDTNPSLSIGEGRDGRILLNCHAGCTSMEIVRALGLSIHDLFADDDRPAPHAAAAPVPRPTPPTIYDYRDENGAILFQAVRGEDKRFQQRRPDGEGGWSYSLGDVRRVLYRLHEFLDFDGIVFVVEGEKDADRMRAEGFVATTSSAGALSAAKTDWTPLHGRRIVIIPDHDEPGEKYASAVRELLGDRAKTSILHLPDPPHAGYDVSDYFDQGGTADDLREFVREAIEPVLVDVSVVDHILHGNHPPIEALVEGFLTKRSISSIYGPGGAGKSTLALQLSIAIQTGGTFAGRQCAQGDVLLVDVENVYSTLKDRIERVLGDAGEEQIDGYRTLAMRSQKPSFDLAKEKDRELVFEAVLSWAKARENPALVVFDCLREMHSAKENESDEMKPVLDLFRRAGEAAGCAALVLHNSNKAGEARGSSYYEGLFYFIYGIVPPKHEENQEESFLLRCQKVREIAKPKPMRYVFDSRGVLDFHDADDIEEMPHDLDPFAEHRQTQKPKLLPAQRELLDVLKRPEFSLGITKTDLADLMPDVPEKTIHSRLKRLVELNRVEEWPPAGRGQAKIYRAR